MKTNNHQYQIKAVTVSDPKNTYSAKDMSRTLEKVGFTGGKGAYEDRINECAIPQKSERIVVECDQAHRSWFKITRIMGATQSQIVGGQITSSKMADFGVILEGTGNIAGVGKMKLHWKIACAKTTPIDLPPTAPPTEPSQPHVASPTDQDSLTFDEQRQLEECEKDIKNGLGSFYAIGRSLKNIQTKRLYRGKYATFETYCRERWNIARSQAYRLIQAFDLCTNLRPGPIPENERQARELISLPPQHIKVVWEKVVRKAGGKTISTRLIHTVIMETVAIEPKKSQGDTLAMLNRIVQSLDRNLKPIESELESLHSALQGQTPEYRESLVVQLEGSSRRLRKLLEHVKGGSTSARAGSGIQGRSTALRSFGA